MARKRSHTRRASRINPRGRIELHKGGFGFAQTAEGEFFIPRNKTGGAFPDDIVDIAPIKRYGTGQTSQKGREGKGMRRTARVVAVVERASDEVLGYFHRDDPFGVVVPVDVRIPHDIFVPLDQAEGVDDGAVVRVRMLTYPDRHTAAFGTIEGVVGDGEDEHVAIDLIVSQAKLETEFSAASLEQAAQATIDAEGALVEGYEDVRERCVFTIDPDDARDFDDAVSLDRAQLPDGTQGWRLGVHIADVSHYVEWGSSIDLDARRRATSVYLVDRVIPMLPEQLSNDMCSLRPGEDRRTMSVDMLVRPNGEVVNARPYRALIRSAKRLTYGQAQAVIDQYRARNVEALLDSHDVDERVQARIVVLSQLAQRFRQRRQKAGALDFDTVEAKVRLDASGHPVAVDLREKTEATELIEEAMVTANEAVARYLHEQKFPCMYRVHEQPDPSTLEGLAVVLDEFSWFKHVNRSAFCAGSPQALQAVLAEVSGRPEDELVTTLVLRSMQRAFYSPQCDGHYGLASDAYAHFTSPIRRYPDLVVHRMLKAQLFRRPEKFDQETSSLQWLSEHSSEMERVAERAARDSQEVKIIELMEEHIGEEFDGIVVGVATFGLFVQLPNTAEGIVEMADLGNEYFSLDALRHTLTGSDTGRQYRLGQKMRVRLIEADSRLRQLRLKPVRGRKKL